MERTLQFKKQVYGPTGWYTGHAFLQLAFYFHCAHKPQVAKDYYQTTLSIYQKHLGDDNSIVISLYFTLTDGFEIFNDFDEAAKYKSLIKQLSQNNEVVRKKIMSYDGAEFVNENNGKGLGRVAKVKESAKRSQKIKFPQNKWMRGYIGIAYNEFRNYNLAIEYYKQYLNDVDIFSLEAANVFYHIGNFYFQLNIFLQLWNIP